MLGYFPESQFFASFNVFWRRVIVSWNFCAVVSGYFPESLHVCRVCRFQRFWAVGGTPRPGSPWRGALGVGPKCLGTAGEISNFCGCLRKQTLNQKKLDFVSPNPYNEGPVRAT